jgi:glycosyltransferase involved in cell wall biosynthesis
VLGRGDLTAVQVGVLTTGFPRHDGDLAGNFVFFGCRALRDLGLKLTVVAPHTAGTAREETVEGIPVRRFRYFLPPSWQRVAYASGGPSNLRRSWLAWLGLPAFTVSYWLHARRLARRCQILHAHWIPSGLIALASSPFGRRPPVVVSVWGSDLSLARHPLLGRLTIAALRHASAIVAISETMKRELLALGLPEEKVVVVPTAISPMPPTVGSREDVRRALGLPPDRLLVLYLGRLEPVKGLGHLVEAAGLVLAEVPKAAFVLVGGGHLRPELESAVRAKGMTADFFFAGDVRHDEVGRWLSAADLFVMPSLSEGVPHALLEALASGLPAVASAVGGVPEFVRDDVNGYLVAPADPAALAQRVVLLLRDPEKRSAFGDASRKLIEQRRLTWDRFAADVSAVYERALSSAAQPGRRPRPWMPL